MTAIVIFRFLRKKTKNRPKQCKGGFWTGERAELLPPRSNDIVQIRDSHLVCDRTCWWGGYRWYPSYFIDRAVSTEASFSSQSLK